MHESMHQQAACAYNSPVSGLCSDRSGTTAPAAGAAGHAVTTRQSRLNAVFGSDTQPRQLQPSHSLSTRASAARLPLSWTPLTSSKSLSSSTRSMPELWQEAQQPLAARQQWTQEHQQLQPRPQQPADREQLRDQHELVSVQDAAAAAAAGALDSPQQQQQQQQPTPPLEVLLSPLLPSADEHKLAERLSQLRAMLDAQTNLAAGWEQQAAALHRTLAESQQEGLSLRGQLVAAQQHVALLGGNLQGRLSLAQGPVLAQMQEQLQDKDAALAAAQQQLSAIQAQLEQLSCSFAAKLAAEQTERERLAAEASQARLLCMARGRQVTSLQQELEQLQRAAGQQQDSAAAAAGLQQQQLEGLHQRLQQLQGEAAAAQAAVGAAEQKVAASEGGKAALRQQVEELQGLLAEKQLQVEWLEGKVSDLEGCDTHQQFKRHSSDVSRIQAAAAADRQALEQQLAAAQRQVAQLQQQEAAQQQLQQQHDALQQQLHESQKAQQEAIQQAQQLAQQLAQAEDELQQLQGELEAAREDAAAAEQQLQQQLPEGMAAAAAAAAGGGGEDGELHALRAQLGIAKAEVARLQHELEVTSASRTQERQLTGQEIWRLQHELSEAAAAASSAASGSRGIGSCRRSGGRRAAAAGDASEAGSEAAEEPEVTSGAAAQLADLLQQPEYSGDEGVPLDRGEPDAEQDQICWEAVHSNPAFEQPGCAAATPGKWQQSSEAAAAAAADDAAEQELVSPGAGGGGGAAKAARYQARLQDQADTIASLQQQLKQQQQLLAALQRRERRVYDSAASRSSWVDVLGLDQQQQQQQQQEDEQPAAAAAAAPVADAAVQTDGHVTESAGSTAAPPAAGYEATSPIRAAGPEHQQQHQHPGRQQQQHQHPGRQQQQHQQGGDALGEVAAGNALLAAARHEIQRLQELNQQLLLTHADELRSSVSFEDARRAVAEAKQHAKAKAAAVLKEHSRAWSDKLAAVRAQRQQLQQEVQQLQQQREELAAQVAFCGRCAAADQALQQLQSQLDASQQQVQQLRTQMAALADSHSQELDQVRMEAETDAAAAMLDAAAAAAGAAASQQRREAAVQADLRQQQQQVAAKARSSVDAAVQTEVPQQAQQQPPPAASPVEAASQQQAGLQEQQQASASAADERPRTPQPAAASSAAGAAASAAAAEPASPAAAAAAGAAAEPAAAEPAAVRSFVQPWHAAAGAAVSGAAADAGDDDLCRMSSASDTPIASKLPGSSSGHLAELCAPAAAGQVAAPHGAAAFPGAPAAAAGAASAAGLFFVEAGGAAAVGTPRPDTAGTNGGLPELTESTSPVAAVSYSKLLPPGDSQWRPLQQQQQQQQQQQPVPVAAQQSRQLQQQQQAAAEPDQVAQLSEWHVELLQQQAQLDMLKVRLSQHQQARGGSPFSQRQRQQQPALQAGNRYAAAAGAPAAGAFQVPSFAPAGQAPPSADTRPWPGAAAAGDDGRAVLGSPAPPVASSSSPLTFQQRRLQQQRQQHQQQAPWHSFERPDNDTSTSQLLASPAAAAATSHNSRHLLYGLQGSAAATFSNANNGRSSAHLDDAAGIRLLGASGASGSGLAWQAGEASQQFAASGTGQQHLWQQQQQGAAPGLMHQSSQGHSALRSSSSSAALQASGSGLVQLGADVMGALSLSRIHKERSKLQEARAKQHALMAAHHEGQAAALRSSRLSGGS